MKIYFITDGQPIIADVSIIGIYNRPDLEITAEDGYIIIREAKNGKNDKQLSKA